MTPVSRLSRLLVGFFVIGSVLPRTFADPAPAAGLFPVHQDVGAVLHVGTFQFDPAAKTYTISASGENMWAKADAIHFAWQKASGDLSITADIAFKGAGTDPYRKACLMVRQSLDADSPYVDVAIHEDGLTSLQFRESKGAATCEVQANVKAPKRVRQIRRMKPDGSDQQRVTPEDDAFNNWFPHPSPDGKRIAFVTYHYVP